MEFESHLAVLLNRQLVKQMQVLILSSFDNVPSSWNARAYSAFGGDASPYLDDLPLKLMSMRDPSKYLGGNEPNIEGFLVYIMRPILISAEQENAVD